MGQEETQKLKERGEFAVYNAIDSSVTQPLYEITSWIDENDDLFRQLSDSQMRAIRGATQRLCALVGINTTAKIDSTAGVRRRKGMEKEQILEKWLYYTQRGEPFGHKELAEHFGNTMNDGKPVQRTFYMKQVEGLMHSGFIKDITEGDSKTATQVFQYQDYTDAEREMISDYSNWPITKPGSAASPVWFEMAVDPKRKLKEKRSTDTETS